MHIIHNNFFCIEYDSSSKTDNLIIKNGFLIMINKKFIMDCRIILIIEIAISIIFIVSGGVLLWCDKVDLVNAANYNTRVGKDKCSVIPISISNPLTCHDTFDTRPDLDPEAQCEKQVDDPTVWHCSYTCYMKNINVTLSLRDINETRNFNIVFPFLNQSFIECYYDANYNPLYLTIYGPLYKVRNDAYNLFGFIFIFLSIFIICSIIPTIIVTCKQTDKKIIARTIRNDVMDVPA